MDFKEILCHFFEAFVGYKLADHILAGDVVGIGFLHSSLLDLDCIVEEEVDYSIGYCRSLLHRSWNCPEGSGLS